MRKTLFFITGLLGLWQNYNAQPANDNCTGATAIVIPASGNICVTGTTTGAGGTTYTSHPCFPTNTNIPDVWYTFIAAGSQNTVTITPNGGTPAQQVGFTMTSTPCGSTTSDICNLSSTNNGSATGSWTYAVGTQVWVNVGTIAATGGFQICVTSVTPPPSPGSSCATAAVLCDKNSFTLNSFPNNSNAFTPGCFFSSLQRPVFYKFTVGQTGTLEWIASINGTAEYDWAVYNITGGCPGTQVGCNYNYASGNSGSIGMQNGPGACSGEFCDPVTVTAGNTYVIIIDNYSNSTTGFTMSWPATGTFQMAPTAQFTVGTATGCGSVTTGFTNSSLAASTYSWNFGNGNTSTATSPPAQTYSTPGNYLVSLTATSASGCVDNASQTVIVKDVPTVTVPANVTVCNGNAIPATTLTSSPAGATYTWTNSNTAIGLAASGAGNVPSFNAINVGSSVVTGVITVTPTLNGCVGTPSSYTITVNPGPSVNAVTSITACSGASVGPVSFTSTPAGATYTWTNSNTAIGLVASGTTNIPVFTATNAGSTNLSGTITVMPTLSGCSGAAGTFTITISPLPTVNAISSFTVCEGASAGPVNFTSTPAGSTYAWSNSNTAIGLAASGTGSVAAFTAANGTSASINGTVSVTPTLAGCTGTPGTFTITVDPLPVVTPVTDIIVCNGGTVGPVNFSSTPAGASYTWSNSNTAIGLGSSGVGNIGSFTGTNSGAGSISGTITITPTLNTCVGPTSTFSITITPPPTSNPVANITVCDGAAVGPISFTSNPAGATFGWSNSNTAIGLGANGVGNIPSFTAVNGTSASVSAVISYIPNLSGCIGVPATFTITVDPLPTVTTVSDFTVCNGSSTSAVNFTSNPSGASFAWTNGNTAIGLSAGSTGNLPAFSATNPGTSSITGVVNVVATLNTCVGPASSFTITVDPSPVVDPVTSFTICNGASSSAVNLTSTPPGATIPWANPNASIGLAASGTGTIPSFTGTNPGSAPINTIIVCGGAVLNGCTGPQSTFTITIDPSPIVNPVANITVCDQATVPASVYSSTPSGATYTWSNSNTLIGLIAGGTGNAPSFTATNSSASAITGVVSVTPTLNSCVGSPLNYTITVNATPAAPGVGTVAYCLNAAAVPLTATASPGGTLNWYGTSPGIPPSSATPTTPSTSAAGTTNYYVSQSINGCEGPVDSIPVTVTNPPTMTAPANVSICNGSAVSSAILSSNPAGGTFTWTNTNTVIGLAGSGTGNIPGFNAVNSGNSPINGVVSITPAMGTCIGAAVSYTITVNPTPTGNQANQVACNGALVGTSAFSSTPAGGTFSWTNSNTSIGIGANGSGNIPSFTGINTGATVATATITVTPTVNTCAGTPFNYTITINPTPSAPLTTNLTYCKNASALALTAIAGGSLNWYGTFMTGGTPSAAAPIPSTVVAGTTTYYVSQTVSNCEGPRAPLDVLVNPLPVPTISQQISGCTPVCGTFTVSSTPALVTSNFSMGDGTSLSGSPVSHCYANPGSYNITVLITDVNGCSSTTSFNNWVNAFEVPVADFTFGPQPTSIIFPDISFINTSTGGTIVSNSWSFGDSLLSSSSLTDPTFTYLYPGTYDVQLDIVNSFGCVNTAVKQVVIDDDFVIYIPNAFSPNNDGLNDTFYPQGIGMDPANYDFSIYDRWGQLVFHTTEMSKHWDGKMSETVMQDTYVWKLKVKNLRGDKKQLVGHVTVVR
ncbi:MAG: PKD domain-containing protein [Bacteroidia bacterium]